MLSAYADSDSSCESVEFLANVRSSGTDAVLAFQPVYYQPSTSKLGLFPNDTDAVEIDGVINSEGAVEVTNYSDLYWAVDDYGQVTLSSTATTGFSMAERLLYLNSGYGFTLVQDSDDTYDYYFYYTSASGYNSTGKTTVGSVVFCTYPNGTAFGYGNSIGTFNISSCDASSDVTSSVTSTGNSTDTASSTTVVSSSSSGSNSTVTSSVSKSNSTVTSSGSKSNSTVTTDITSSGSGSSSGSSSESESESSSVAAASSSSEAATSTAGADKQTAAHFLSGVLFVAIMLVF